MCGFANSVIIFLRTLFPLKLGKREGNISSEIFEPCERIVNFSRLVPLALGILNNFSPMMHVDSEMFNVFGY